MRDIKEGNYYKSFELDHNMCKSICFTINTHCKINQEHFYSYNIIISFVCVYDSSLSELPWNVFIVDNLKLTKILYK